jgi:hypothetical protein
VKQTEFKTANNNRCPLCRQELFEQEDFGSGGDALYSGDEALVNSDDFDDSTDDEGMETDDERYWQTLAALLGAPQARHAHLADPSLGTITDPVEERRQSANVLEVIDPSAERVQRAYSPETQYEQNVYSEVTWTHKHVQSDCIGCRNRYRLVWI